MTMSAIILKYMNTGGKTSAIRVKVIRKKENKHTAKYIKKQIVDFDILYLDKEGSLR
ncbi:hypothetical protein J18TS1_35730 [Oceanobacillus oncorhynchi subsp. incaldanensis]|uniref:Uncharacterized protein n=1 Tax=Oceanobacillus oncorhynchi TaxID=545501 RepID=A0A0A1MST7_9BACI|nr:hypothetical protein J18TS1_35730 [Oceanobacillus oncorhynchi subsp. incaldanensis]CEI82729.1 hypothetical protein BN997_02615 [Oceanobacillus oncorhynchi]